MSYFPVLRARQYELIALRELSDLLSDSLIVPVMEPITSGYLASNLPLFVEAGMEFCLIVNPRLPRSQPLTQDEVFNELVLDILDEHQSFRPTLYVNGQTQPAEIQAFSSRYAPLELERAYFLTSDPTYDTTQAILDDEARYVLCREISGGTRNRFNWNLRVLIEDHFHPQNNADYPPSESFSDRHLGSAATDFAHFGDYSIIGDIFRETGGLPFAVAIHYMTVRHHTGNALELRHYISDQNQTRGKVAEKFFEALAGCGKMPNSHEFFCADELGSLLG
ncbi:MAG: sce7725 family protein [Candidatus Binatus sp.]|uniref:sce7725 family protein n=1 Tax=Candidatus Binatus sp. TaxID=2811406 RepID=UPI0027236C66|nr:sce7725 family protein [Candidatus Binatus sp.]MDO8434348.1 sce7725 family protein [Candidatus Binatus sp.]